MYGGKKKLADQWGVGHLLGVVVMLNLCLSMKRLGSGTSLQAKKVSY